MVTQRLVKHTERRLAFAGRFTQHKDRAHSVVEGCRLRQRVADEGPQHQGETKAQGQSADESQPPRPRFT